MRPPIREGDARAGHQIFHGVGHEDLAGLGCPQDTRAGIYRDAADSPVVILDLTGVYADPHRHLKSLHGIADRIPAADGGGGNPEAWWEIAGERPRHDGAGSAAGVKTIGQGNSWLGLALESSITPPADAWHAPIETVSNSEAGFERVYQGGALLLSWLVRIAAGESWSASIEHRAAVAVDRAAAEAGELLGNLA